MQCPVCRAIVPDNATFCGTCGRQLSPQAGMYQGEQQYGGYPQQQFPPGGYPGGAPAIPDYLVWSILEMLFCCMPFGIVGLIFSINANSAKAAGRYEEAMQNAKQAKTYLSWGIGLWAIAFILYIGVIILAAIGNSM